MLYFLFLFVGLGLSFSSSSFSLANTDLKIPKAKLGINNASCPLNFNVLRKLIVDGSQPLVFLDVPTECHYILQGIRLLQSEYIRTTRYFFPPPNSSDSCWDLYENLVNEFIPGFSIRSTCGFKTSMISGSCMNITNQSQFESLVSESRLQQVLHSCNQSLEDDSHCASCTHSLSTIYMPFFSGIDIGNVSDCSGYPFIYAGGLANRFGPADLGTAKCLFSLDFTSKHASKGTKKMVVLCAILSGSVFGLLGTIVVICCFWRGQKRGRRRKRNMAQIERGLDLEMEMISGNSTLVKFTFEEVKKATKNFSRENIIGKGGYGNVYKGILEDGSEVALKRFKNCSAVGDAVFAHELEVIASVRHVNLVNLRGYCTETIPMEGHQRIIACDLMHNGSLYDNLFGSSMRKKLSWPIRQKIALGMAQGLAYLHYGAQPAIIHRDVKASNILLDEIFEPKLADFGLAKFTPEGLSHLSTKVAGTLGYVAPEYALYGQLTERSDVYSFGVVLLELLSGKKAVISVDDHDTLLLTDWAWSLVKEGRALDVIDESMPELGPMEVMEKYVLVAVLSSHPLLYARPMMDQIVNMLETNFPVPSIPDHPFSLLADIDGIELLTSFSGSHNMLSRIDWNPQSDHPILDR